MQRVRLRHLSFPLAFLLPIALVYVGVQNDPPHAAAHRQRAALTAFAEPSPEIEAALSAERRRIIEEANNAEIARVDEETRVRLVAEAEIAAAIEAKNAVEAAEAKAAAEAAEAEAARVARTKAAAAKAAAAKIEVAATRPTPVTPTPRTGTGSLPPDYVKQCESGGNYQAVNPNGHYGAWQFSQATWNGVGGTGRPDHASPEEQDYRASILWNNGKGAGNWECF